MIVLDTHVLVWALAGDVRLGKVTEATIKETAKTDRVAISAITPWEISLLVKKGKLRLEHEVGSWIKTALSSPNIYLVPLESEIAIDSVYLPGDFHSDPADRFIVATARYLDVPLVTADGKILSYAATGHVQVMDATA